MILLEEYRAGNKNIENALGELKKALPIIKNDYKGKSRNIKFTENKHISNMCKHLSKEFGGTIYVYISPVSPMGMGALTGPHTVPGSFKFFKRTSDGKLDTRNTNSYIFIDSVSAVECNLTAEEILAIILHEIGHNIDNSPMTLLRQNIALISSYGVSNLINEVIHISYGPVGNILQNIPSVMKSALHKMNMGISSLLTVLSPLAVVGSAMSIPASMINLTFLGYYGERFGDSVATSYGYGSHLMTGLEKITSGKYLDKGKFKDGKIVKKMINTNPITGLLYDLTDASLMALSIIVAPHPSNINRAKNSLSRLKEERSHGHLPKPMIKDLDVEIERLEEFINASKTIEPKQYNFFTSTMNKVMGLANGRNRNILDVISSSKDYEY